VEFGLSIYFATKKHLNIKEKRPSYKYFCYRVRLIRLRGLVCQSGGSLLRESVKTEDKGALLTVDIWTIDIPWEINGSEKAEDEVLSQQELEQATRFRFFKDTRHFLMRRRALRRILSRYVNQNPRELKFSTNKNGKPRPNLPDRGADDWAFNFSHSRDLALLALARGEEVGVDVEYALKPIPDLYEVLQVICREEEVQQFLVLPKTWHQRAFFKLWTIKEAYLKALGTGLSREPDTVCLRISHNRDDVCMALEEGGWQVITFEPRPGYLASIALKTERPIQIAHFDFSGHQETGSMGR
jgi:4'-phosphopantetheinyl transferase